MLGQAAVVAALLEGFGAVYESVPAGAGPLVLAPAAACLVLAPRGRTSRARVSLPLLALLAWTAASWSWSVSPGTTARALVDVVLPVVVVVLVAGVLGRTALARAVLWTVRLTLVAVVLTLLARPETRASGTDEFLVEGWRGSFPDKNSLALFLTAALAAVLALDRGRSRLLTAVVVGALLVGAQSATGGTGAVLVLLVAVFLRVLRRRPGRAAAVLVLGTTTLVAAFTALVIGNLQTVLGVYGRDADLTGRTEIWAAVLDAVGERPLHGYGLQALLNLQEPSTVTYALWDAIGFPAVHAHNGALDLVGQIGLVGLLLHLAVVVQTLRLALARGSSSEDCATWALLLLPAVALMSATEPVLLGGWLLLLAVVQAALLQPASAHRGDGARPARHRLPVRGQVASGGAAHRAP